MDVWGRSPLPSMLLTRVSRNRSTTSINCTMTSAGNRIGVVQTGVICVAAYLIGVALSPYLLPVDFLSSKLPLLHRQDASMTAEPPTATTSAASQPTALPGNPPTWSPHEAAYKSIVDFEGRNDPFYQVDIVVHRNGESDPCSRQQRSTPDEKEIDDTTALSSTSRSFLNSINALGNKSLYQYQKYDVDAMLTHTLAGVGGDTSGTQSFLLENGNSCGPTWTTKNHYLDESPQLTNNEVLSSMIKFCDMGVDKTPIQLDHHKMVRVPKVGSLPCHFHTREGVRITSLGQLAQFAREAKVPDGECTEKERTVDGNSSCGTAEAGGEGGKSSVGRRELHLYAVQAGRMFVFAPKYVGEIFELPHVEVPLGLPVWLEVISLSPRVFDIFNFFDREESAAIVDKALKETSETHRMKRSSTGASGYTVNSQRTSENGFDTHGTQAQAVKHRCLNVLGFDEYEESLTDGLQVLRYNKTTAYIPHLDWIDDYQKQNEHNFDTEHLGSNRFATILLYMTDLQEGDGGETVFTHGWPPGLAEEDRIQFEDARNALRESGDVEGILERDSWEEKMVANCRSRLSIRPHSSRAVLFYSQNPDGTPDQNSLHGGCPVIKGEKWAANLWVWNAPRNGFPGSPRNQDVIDRNRAAGKPSPHEPQQLHASFTNTKSDESMKNAVLFFQDTFWGKLGFGDPPLYVNTYKGHEWNVKVDDVTVKKFVIDDTPQQSYTI